VFIGFINEIGFSVFSCQKNYKKEDKALRPDLFIITEIIFTRQDSI
jgi:hypothetical protein